MSSAHDHGTGERNRRRLAITLGLVLVYMGAEVVGGFLTNSLALLADAGHMLSDAFSLGLALFAIWIARRPATLERTFGYHRAEILAALANGVTLVVIAIYIVLEAWERFQSPQEVAGREMLAIATGGLVINLIGLWILRGGREDSLNVRGAWLHVLADTLGSAQAMGAGVLIWAFGWNWADPAASVLIAILVVWSSWTLLRDSVNVLMLASPRDIDVAAVRRALEEIEGVREVHDLHVWTVTSGFESISVHARVSASDRDSLLEEVCGLLGERFGLEHATVQLEGRDMGCVCRGARA